MTPSAQATYNPLDISFLDEVETMRGTIRTKERCPVCGKPFQHFPKGIVGHTVLTTTQKHYSHIEVEAKRRVLQQYSLKKGAEVIELKKEGKGE